MTGKDVVAAIRTTQTADHHFVKWWRNEEDWLDFDDIETFIANTRADEEIGGFELLGMEEMWDYLQKVAPGRVSRAQKGGEQLVVWTQEPGKDVECPYTPASLVSIFDNETGGNYVD
jgi:hypothetical protein